jgi:hypothetical protein
MHFACGAPTLIGMMAKRVGSNPKQNSARVAECTQQTSIANVNDNCGERVLLMFNRSVLIWFGGLQT